MDEIRSVQIARGTHLDRATIVFGLRADACHVELRTEFGQSWTADKVDYWECLTELRHALEREGALILCQGARRDVWPSGMARSMGAGLKAYVLAAKATQIRLDLVVIFDPADLSLVCTVAEQEQTRDAWVASRGMIK